MKLLFKHQEEGIAFLKEKKRAILADQMGLGKTRQAIVAAGETTEGTILVICPASLKINWRREIEQVYPEDQIGIVSGTAVDIVRADSEMHHNITPETDLPKIPWLIINYDILEKYKASLLKLHPHTVILDEAHYIKERKTIRTKETLEIVKDAEQVYALTGTPIMNRPIELFTLLQAISHPLGKYVTHYAKRYCGGQMKTLIRDKFSGKSFFVMPARAWSFRSKPQQYTVLTFMDETGATRLPELKSMTADIFLRRTKKEVLDLPEKIISTREVTLSEEWQSAYDNAWDKYLAWVEAHPEGRDVENIVSAQQLIELGKLKQVCSLAKIDRIVADVEEAIAEGEKIIIFSQYTETIKTLEVKLRRHHAVTLTGADDMDERQAAVDAFQKYPECKVFIGNIKAAGVGITLTAATIVIFADMDWSPAVNEQAEDRAHRIGQEGTVNIYYYVCEGTIEEDIVRTLLDKQSTIGQIMGEDNVQKALFALIENLGKKQAV